MKNFAFHIVGGEMIYNDLGNGKYQIILKIYRDCAAANASQFDGLPNYPVAYLTVYDAANTLVGTYDIGSPVITLVPSAFNNACIQAPNTICIQEGVYTYTLDLPPKAGGYTLVYQRCCRNSIIENLANPDFQGATYFAEIPGPEKAVANNSPRFPKFPPIYICRKVPFKFDHSAVDPDGDQLVYALCAPFAGLEGCCASLNSAPAPAGPNCAFPPSFCPTAATPPPYTNVLFKVGYNGAYPIDSNPAFSINPATGQLVGTPTLVGQYVVGVCVKEFRNNVLLNTHFRDFQFTVINCTVAALSLVADQEQKCQGQSITFTNQSTNNSTNPVYHWDFGVPTLSTDTSNLFNPTYLYPDTGIYIITLITNPGKPCTDTLKKPIYIYPPLDINYQRPDRQCLSNNSFDFTVKGTYLPQATYLWNFTSDADPSTATITAPKGVVFKKAGLFFVKLYAQQFACRDSFIDSVRILRRPEAIINNLPASFCNPGKVGFSNGSFAEEPLKYFWSFSNGQVSTEFEPTQVFSPSGIYNAELKVVTSKICRDSSIIKSVNFTVHPAPVAGFSVYPKEVSIFEPLINVKSLVRDSASYCFFNFGDGIENYDFKYGYHIYNNYGSFRITQYLSNSFGCADSISDVIKVLPEYRFWIPNAFTPDENALNDIFKPSVIGVTNYEFQIYDRWGERLFVTKDPLEGWNGLHEGEECQEDIYTWKILFINVVTEELEVHYGHFILLKKYW